MAKTFRAWEIDQVWMLAPTVRCDLSLGQLRGEAGVPAVSPGDDDVFALARVQPRDPQLAQDRGDHRSRYRLRKQTAEPVIGNLKDRNGVRQFLLRGLKKVALEWSLACTAHNLLKLASARA